MIAAMALHLGTAKTYFFCRVLLTSALGCTVKTYGSLGKGFWRLKQPILELTGPALDSLELDNSTWQYIENKNQKVSCISACCAKQPGVGNRGFAV